MTNIRSILNALAGFVAVSMPVLACLPALAGEIPGMEPPRLPTLDKAVVELYDVNDNLGRGKAVDDFRTEQIGLVLSLGERWLAAFDYSILTLDKYANGRPLERVDQISGSVGYRLLQNRAPARGSSLSIGAGFRATDNYGGARVQNGFHQLVNDRIVPSPYVDGSDTDLTAWLRAEHAGPLPWSRRDAGPGGWRTGYWLHGATLVTSDGQSDGTVIANLTLSRGLLDTWLGLRGDWRSGYDQDDVQSAVANNEQGGYVSVGLRYGPIIVETAQGFDADKAFGRIGLLGGFGESPRASRSDGASSLTVGVTVPRAQVVLQGRLPLCKLFGCGLSQRWRLLGDLRYGRPADGTAPDKYIEASQVTVGVEVEDRQRFLPPWLTAYVALSAGWRQEELYGELDLNGYRASNEGSAVVMGDTGLRMALQPPGQAWRFRAQVGLSGWLPADSRRVNFNGGTERVLKPDASLLFGVVVDF